MSQKRNNYFLKRGAIVTLLLSLTVGKINAQSKVIPLWEKEVPGAIANQEYKETLDSLDNWTKMRFVTNPRLDMYSPPAGKANGTAVIICPGGAYWGLAVKHEGKEVAEWFNEMGITAFVLKYRLPSEAIMKDKSIGPLQDGQRAIRLVRSHAKEWSINPDKIGIMGFSAGGHFAATVSTHFMEKVYESTDTTSSRPDFSLLIYPVISMNESITHAGSRYNLLGANPSPEQIKRFSNELQVTGNTPPAFMVHSMDDAAVPVQNSVNYAMALQKNKVSCELHLYKTGGHGYGLGKSINTESSWPEACRKWLQSAGFSY